MALGKPAKTREDFVSAFQELKTVLIKLRSDKQTFLKSALRFPVPNNLKCVFITPNEADIELLTALIEGIDATLLKPKR